MKTRVCRLYSQGDLRIDEDDVNPPVAGEVLVAIGAGGICGSDLHYYQHGGFGPVQVREPMILGHEVAGTILSAGPSVTTLKAGDRVAINPSHPCGNCTYCEKSMFRHCLNMRFFGSAMLMPHVQGGFRDKMVVKAEQCVPVSAHTSLAEAACAEPLAVCLHAASHADDMAGKSVLVTGTGPIGALCIAVAKYHGASEIIATDLTDEALEIARHMGATQTHNALKDAEAMRVYAEHKGHFDIAFECSSAAPAIRTACETIRPRGSLIQVGVAADLPVPINILVGKEIQLKGSFRFDREYAQAVELIDSGKIDVKPIITSSYKLEDAKAAFDIAGDRKRSVKVQLSFAESGGLG